MLERGTVGAIILAIGVVVSSGAGGEYGGQGSGPTFLFTKLNDLKPTMIAEATALSGVVFSRTPRTSLKTRGHCKTLVM